MTVAELLYFIETQHTDLDAKVVICDYYVKGLSDATSLEWNSKEFIITNGEKS